MSPTIEVNPTIDVSLDIEKLRNLQIPNREEAIVEIVKEFNETLRTIGIPNRVQLSQDLNLNSVQQQIAEAVDEKVNEAVDQVKHPVGEPETYIKLGNFEKGGGNYDKALNYFDAAIALDSTNVDAWIGKGQALWSKGNSLRHAEQDEAAISCYDDALACYDGVRKLSKGALQKTKYPPPALLFLDENIIFALENKGDTLSLLGRFDEAILCYDKILKIDPDYAPAWGMKVIAYEIMGKSALAANCMAEAEKALERSKLKQRKELAKIEKLKKDMQPLLDEILGRKR
jgi:tetratricopeptide (TPR) repeat protein